ncbi:hypothetical protein AN963_01610 [Brevibacillus choshinensis]|uniref:Uncharacterized protein n=1 Tax=Brevibacillus choshinensis TaxID=54911 RepID=A0ABR5NAF3_BRECH|nr:hypothetical protein AN963_01610 [Brevibacillus choshinensis]
MPHIRLFPEKLLGKLPGEGKWKSKSRAEEKGEISGRSLEHQQRRNGKNVTRFSASISDKLLETAALDAVSFFP